MFGKNLNTWEMIVAFPSREGGFVHVLFLSSAAACMETDMANERNLRALTMLHAHGNEYSREIPSVTLSGIWLNEAGFRLDDKVSAELTDDGKLAVTKQASDQQMKKTAPSEDCFRVTLFHGGNRPVLLGVS